jgi:hypothetical protein
MVWKVAESSPPDGGHSVVDLALPRRTPGTRNVSIPFATADSASRYDSKYAAQLRRSTGRPGSPAGPMTGSDVQLLPTLPQWAQSGQTERDISPGAGDLVPVAAGG